MKHLRWAIQWRSENRITGKSEFFTWERGVPVLFRTRKQARKHIKQRYGYIATTPSLKVEPHGWKMPRPMRVEVKFEQLA